MVNGVQGPQPAPYWYVPGYGLRAGEALSGVESLVSEKQSDDKIFRHESYAKIIVSKLCISCECIASSIAACTATNYVLDCSNTYR